jgi:hypothetical protein
MALSLGRPSFNGARLAPPIALAARLFGFAGVSCSFYSVIHLPLAEATLLQLTHSRAAARRSARCASRAASSSCPPRARRSFRARRSCSPRRSALFFGERPDAWTLAGGGLVLGGAWLAGRSA